MEIIKSGSGPVLMQMDGPVQNTGENTIGSIIPKNLQAAGSSFQARREL